MAHFVNTELNDGTTVLNVYNGISTEELTTAVGQKLNSNGYSIIPGKTPDDVVYEKGNRILRLLLGAFVKYYKFGVHVENGPDGTTTVSVKKQTSGMSGGLIGIGQVKNELKRLAQELSTI